MRHNGSMRQREAVSYWRSIVRCIVSRWVTGTICVYPVALQCTGSLRWEDRLRLLACGRGGMGLVVGCSMLLLLWGVPIVNAELTQHSAEDGTTVVTKEVIGKVSAVNASLINIIYQSDKEKGVDYELPLSIGKDVELRYKQSLNQIRFGDTVKVAYAEKQAEAERQTADGKRERYTRVVSREAKTITFLSPAKILSPAKKRLVSGE